jgi:peroxiredoxin Q/BCP
MSIGIGDPVPDFNLKDQNGKEFYLSNVVGKKNLVIYFYPKNFTPGCVKEACSFRDSFEEFRDAGAEVIGISSDSETSHAKFAARYNLPFILLSDQKGVVRRKFGVKSNFFGMLPGRETYVVNKEGRVISVFDSMNGYKHMNHALEMLKKENT